MTSCGSTGGRLAPLSDCPWNGGVCPRAPRRLFWDTLVLLLSCLAVGLLCWAAWGFFLEGVAWAAVMTVVQATVRQLVRWLA